jgi:hypothetical protein
MKQRTPQILPPMQLDNIPGNVMARLGSRSFIYAPLTDTPAKQAKRIERPGAIGRLVASYSAEGRVHRFRKW